MINPYRDEVVQQIKEAGQELIDRAESLVGKGLTEITDVRLVISVGRNTDEMIFPEITVQTSVAVKNTIDRLQGNR
jgi:hypothetical protein